MRRRGIDCRKKERRGPAGGLQVPRGAEDRGKGTSSLSRWW